MIDKNTQKNKKNEIKLNKNAENTENELKSNLEIKSKNYKDPLSDLTSIKTPENDNSIKEYDNLLQARDNAIEDLNNILGIYLHYDIRNYRDEDQEKLNQELTRIAYFIIDSTLLLNKEKLLTKTDRHQILPLLEFLAVGSSFTNSYQFLINFKDDETILTAETFEKLINAITLSEGLDLTLFLKLQKQILTESRGTTELNILKSNPTSSPIIALLRKGQTLKDYEKLVKWLHSGKQLPKEVEKLISLLFLNKENKIEFLKAIFSQKEPLLEPLSTDLKLLSYLNDEKFIQTILDEKNYQLYQFTNCVHITNVIIDVASGAYDHSIRETFTHYLNEYAKGLNDHNAQEAILEIIIIIKKLDSKNYIVSDLTKQTIIFDNNIHDHARYCMINLQSKNNSHTIIGFDGGNEGFVAYDNTKQEKPITAYGIVKSKTKESTVEIKEKILLAIKHQQNFETKLKSEFKKIVKDATHLVGSCTAFSLLLLLEELLKTKGIAIQDFLNFMHPELAKTIITQSQGIDYESLKKEKPILYTQVIGSLIACTLKFAALDNKEALDELFKLPIKGFLKDFIANKGKLETDGYYTYFSPIFKNIILNLLKNEETIESIQDTLILILEIQNTEEKGLSVITKTEYIKQLPEIIETICLNLLENKEDPKKIQTLLLAILQVKNKFGKTVIIQSDYHKLLPEISKKILLDYETLGIETIKLFIEGIFQAMVKKKKNILKFIPNEDGKRIPQSYEEEVKKTVHNFITYTDQIYSLLEILKTAKNQYNLTNEDCEFIAKQFIGSYSMNEQEAQLFKEISSSFDENKQTDL